MIVNLIKFIHILLTLSLLGCIICCLVLLFKNKLHSQSNFFVRSNKLMLWLVFFAMISGTFLVYPKHFTFHTPWIQAAYFFVFIFSLIVVSLIFFGNKLQHIGFQVLIYFLLWIILVGVIHDAVTKTTLF